MVRVILIDFSARNDGRLVDWDVGGTLGGAWQSGHHTRVKRTRDMHRGPHNAIQPGAHRVCIYPDFCVPMHVCTTKYSLMITAIRSFWKYQAAKHGDSLLHAASERHCTHALPN
jgi:hypothetical protein